MYRSFIVIALLMALIVPASALAGDNGGGKKPSPYVLCGSTSCGGGGGYNGCNTVGDVGQDQWGDTQGAYYHWCWSNGQVYNNYGWGSANANYGVQFQGWGEDHDFNYGHVNVGHFALYISPWFANSYRRCVKVDGWGNAWTSNLSGTVC